MIHIEYAVPYWWNYGLFETVPFYIGITWDGCGTFVVNECEGFIAYPEEPISAEIENDKRLLILEKQILVVGETMEAIAKMLAE